MNDDFFLPFIWKSDFIPMSYFINSNDSDYSPFVLICMFQIKIESFLDFYISYLLEFAKNGFIIKKNNIEDEL